MGGPSIRSLFKFKYSSLMLGLLIPMAVGAIMERYYWTAYILFLFSGVWALIHWLLSNSGGQDLWDVCKPRLEAKKENASEKTFEESQRANRAYLLKNTGICALILLSTSSCLYWVYYEQEQQELSLAYGKLYPIDEPVPNDACSEFNEEFLRVFLGPIVGVSVSYPRTIIRIRKNDILSFEKNSDGSISVSLDIKNSDGKLIVRIRNGEFKVSELYSFDIKRPDRSRLKIFDDKGTAVLDLDFFNPRAMKISMLTDGLETSKDGLYMDGMNVLGTVTQRCWGISLFGPRGDQRPTQPMFDFPRKGMVFVP